MDYAGSLADDFHSGSSIAGYHASQERWTDPAHWPGEWSLVQDKRYERGRETHSADSLTPLEMPLGEALLARRSYRDASSGPLPIADLAALARWSAGLSDGEAGVKRTYPSAGARYPLELYAIVLRCPDTPPAILHYEVRPDRLTDVGIPVGRDVVRDVFGFDWVADARAVFVVTGALDRTMVKYGERGYRFALLEAGHIGQNLCLVGPALGHPAVPFGGYADRKLARLLRLDEVGEVCLHTVVYP
jgi:SagB-type dehydrogenase family enzyme